MKRTTDTRKVWQHIKQRHPNTRDFVIALNKFFGDVTLESYKSDTLTYEKPDSNNK